MIVKQARQKNKRERERERERESLLYEQCCSESTRWWSGGAMVLGKLPVPGRPTIWMVVGQGPIALAVGAGGGCLDIFTLLYPFLLFLPLFGRRPNID